MQQRQELAAILSCSKTSAVGWFSQYELQLIEAIYNQINADEPSLAQSLLLQGLSLMPYAWQSRLFDSKGALGSDNLIAKRHMLVRYTVATAIQQQFTQIVFLGGSCDPYSFTVALDNDIKVFEVVDKEILEPKLRVLMQHAETTIHLDGSYQLGSNAHFFPLAENQDWFEMLLGQGFKTFEKTLFVIERFSDPQLLTRIAECACVDNQVFIGVQASKEEDEELTDVFGIQSMVNTYGFNLAAKRMDLGKPHYFLLQLKNAGHAPDNIPDIPLTLLSVPEEKLAESTCVLF